MASPQSLLIAAALLVGLGLLLLPAKRWLWRWRRLARSGERILLEDGLKHLYDCEYQKRQASVESVAGTLEVPRSQAADILIRLEALGLSSSAGAGVSLTDRGRDEALRVVRVHRLWERYLAERTGVQRSRWHREAEKREHQLSAEETESLSRLMGDPAFDPHGDPIPTAHGDLPDRRGVPLTTLPEGELARIEHVEDEPEEVYARLEKAGIYPGMQVQVAATSDEEVRLLVDGDTRSLPPVVAGNVFVRRVRADEEMAGPFSTLAELGVSERARVVRISPACRGLERRRLMDLGIIPGTAVEVEMRSPTGDPTAYRIRGAAIALRRSQADYIHVDRVLEERAAPTLRPEAGA